MITVTRLNGSKLSVNALLIETVEATPDTVISLTTGNRFVVKEDLETVLASIQDYMRSIGAIKATVMSHDWEG